MVNVRDCHLYGFCQAHCFLFRGGTIFSTRTMAVIASPNIHLYPPFLVEIFCEEGCKLSFKIDLSRCCFSRSSPRSSYLYLCILPLSLSISNLFLPSGFESFLLASSALCAIFFQSISWSPGWPGLDSANKELLYSNSLYDSDELTWVIPNSSILSEMRKV